MRSRKFRTSRRLRVEHLFDQVPGHRAVLGDQFLDELVGVGVPAHRHRRQAKDGRPALGPPGEAFQRLRGEPDAMLCHEPADSATLNARSLARISVSSPVSR